MKHKPDLKTRDQAAGQTKPSKEAIAEFARLVAEQLASSRHGCGM
ncbi:MAG: hypothetical protein WCV71_04375 [Patescibacteria group bacterium]